jgi:hypothetical protein
VAAGRSSSSVPSWWAATTPAPAAAEVHQKKYKNCHGKLASATDLTISRVVFVRDGSSVEFDAAADGSQLRRLGGGQMAFGASTDAYADYALDPLLLTAGFWSVLVYGQDSDNKLWSSYELRGSAAPGRVPEPAALALVLVAGLAAAGGATRRKG